MTPSRPRLRSKLALSAGTALVTLLLAEGLLRLLGIGSPGRGSRWFAGGNHPRFLFQPDVACGYELRPGFTGREVSTLGEFETPVSIDARGLRDHAHAAAGKRPILALGDSMTFGEGVRAEEAYPALLEAALGAPVHNAGVPGYGTPQMACRLGRLAPDLEPELVLVTFAAAWDLGRCANPFVYHEGFIVASSYRDRLHLVRGNLYPTEVRWPVVGPLTAYAEGYSNLARLALPALRRWASALAGRGSPAGPRREGYEGCLARLEEGRRVAERTGSRFVAVLVDSPEPASSVETGYVAGLLAARGVPHLLLDRLLAGEDLERLRFPADRHWNRAGHRRVGEALAQWIVEEAMVAAGSGEPAPRRR